MTILSLDSHPDPQPPDVLRLLTFGGLSVHASDGPLGGALTQPRRLAVLALVARGGERGVTRAKLLALLWPDADEEQGRRMLSQALYAIRRDLGSDDTLSGTQDLRLNQAEVWCDVAEFESALKRGDRNAAALLYVAPFLDGFRLASAPEFERWADDERTAIRHRFHEAVEQLARAAEVDGAFDVAVKWWRRRAAEDPLNASVAVAMMRALAAAGDRSGALREARLFEALMRQELELAADRAVVELAAELRNEVRPGARPCVAVLPFEGFDAPEALRNWPEGLAEEIAHALSALPRVSVAARSASIPAAATHAVEGSLRFTPSYVRITARLIDLATRHAVWSGRRDQPFENEHAAQEAAAAWIATDLRSAISL